MKATQPSIGGQFFPSFDGSAPPPTPLNCWQQIEPPLKTNWLTGSFTLTVCGHTPDWKSNEDVMKGCRKLTSRQRFLSAISIPTQQRLRVQALSSMHTFHTVHLELAKCNLSFWIASRFRIGVVHMVVTRAMTTIILKCAGEKIPALYPMLTEPVRE
jgi:hypothetical protein